MTLVLIMLTVQVVLGGLDNLWHHELTERLPQKPVARTELKLHTAREALYAVIFFGVAWWDFRGAWALVLVGLLLTEIVVTLWDFLVEDRTRRLPRLERILHTVLALTMGALLAVWAPILREAAAAPSALVAVDRGLWSWLFTAFALGVLAWSLRDLLAVIDLGVPDWQRRPIRRGETAMPRTVLVTGATGFIGTALTRALITRGDAVIVLARDAGRAAHRFGPHVRIVEDLAVLDPTTAIDAIVNLAGAPLVGFWWTRRTKRRCLDSRLAVTTQIAALIARLARKPAVLVSGSAVGFYGDRGVDVLTETEGSQPMFMAELCRQWEAAACAAAAFGVRVVRLRIGFVLGRDGGALRPLALATRLGLGSVMGGGTQMVSWIHRDDLVRLIAFAIDHDRIAGAVNATAPQPAPQAVFMRTLATTLNRRIRVRAPAWLLRLLLGELSDLFLTSQRALPTAAVFAGFEFRHPSLEAAFAALYRPAPASPGPATTVYVNEDCAVCRTEMAHFGRIAARRQRPLRIASINADPGALAAYGLSEHDIKRRLYARDGDGALVSGIDAVLAVWRTLPRWRVLARAVDRPGLHRIGDLVYEGILVPTIGAWGARRAAPEGDPRAAPTARRDSQHA